MFRQIRHIRKGLGGFARRDDGYVTIEAMIALPVLLTLFASSWVFFDAFRQQSISQKANYTIGDMISRETLEIDDEYINNVQRLFYFLTRTGGTNDSDIRITLVRYDSRADKYFVDWSEARGDPRPLNNGMLRNNFAERLPVMAHADTIIMVETWDKYKPALTFSEGLSTFDITTYSFTRPRYSPQILREDSGDNANWDPQNYNPRVPENEREGRWRNNGWGNGDQDAPGNSLCNNNAENATDCTNSDGSNNTGGGNGNGGGGNGGNNGNNGGGSNNDNDVGNGGGGNNGNGNNNGNNGNNNNGNNGNNNNNNNNSNNNNNNGNGGNYTPPPPPPPPPPAPPGGLR